MRLIIPNLLFFGTIGFMADMFNFAGAQAEILAATFAFNATEFQLGILGACSSLFYAIPAMMTGLLSERLGRRPLVLAALVGMALSYAWGACADSVQELYGVTSLRAVSTAMLWPPVMAWMARAVPARNFSRFLGAYNLSWASGTFLGFWGAGYLFQQVSQTSPFWVAAASATGLLLFLCVASPRGGKGISRSPDGEESDDDYGLSPSQTRYFVRQGLLMAAVGALAANAGLYLFPKIGQELLTELQISALNSVRLVGQMAAFYLMGRFGMWHFKKWPVWTLVMILAAGLVVLAGGSMYGHFIAGFLLVGFGFGAGFSMCAYYALGLSLTKGKGSGMMETMIGVGGLTGPLLGGAVASISTARIGMVSGAVPVMLCAYAATREPKPSQS